MKHIHYHGPKKFEFFVRSIVHTCLDFFVGFVPNQTFLNIMKRSDKGSVLLDWSFQTVLTKYKEHGHHIVVVPKIRLRESDASI